PILWDLRAGKFVRCFETTESVLGMQALSGGKRILGFSTKQLTVWNAATGKRIHSLTGHDGGIMGAAVWPDGSHALSWDYDGVLRVWDLVSGTAVKVLSGDQEMWGAVLLRDGARALCWCEDGSVALWDLQAGVTVGRMRVHGDYVNGLLLISDESQALTWSSDHTLIMWDLTSGNVLRTFRGHGGSVKGAKLLCDSARFISWGRD